MKNCDELRRIVTQQFAIKSPAFAGQIGSLLLVVEPEGRELLAESAVVLKQTLEDLIGPGVAGLELLQASPETVGDDAHGFFLCGCRGSGGISLAHAHSIVDLAACGDNRHNS